MGLIWGTPYLFIKEAVDSFAPAAVVGIRTLGAALLLLPIAARTGALRPALARWPWVLAFGAIEMAGPFMLLSHAEQTLPSGLTGLLVSTVPLVAAALAFVVFFPLIAEVGPTRAPLVTYVNPVVALGLGVAVLDEQITAAMIAGI